MRFQVLTLFPDAFRALAGYSIIGRAVQSGLLSITATDIRAFTADCADLPPTGPMRQEAASAGFYTPEHFPGHQYPRLQIMTIDELLSGKVAQYPRYAPPSTFRRAPRRARTLGQQSGLV